MLKRILSVLAILMLLAVIGCAKKNTGPVTLSVWAFSEELKPYIERFEQQNPNIKVELTVVPNEEYLSKIKPVLRSGKNAPDVFLGEFAYVKDLVESGFWDDLSAKPYKADVSELVKYQVQLGTDSKGKLRAVSWQTTPGGFFYRRSLAKQYLGTDDPEAVGAMLASPEKFIEVGRQLKAKSGGKIKLMASIGDYMWYPLSARTQGFVDKDNKLVVDPAIVNFFDIAKTMRDEKLTAESNQWTPAWFNGMKKGGNIFGYSLPTWGLHYVLKPNAPDSKGDWGLTNGPASYFWGGTWMGVYSKSENKDAAWNFIKTFTLDHDTLKWWAETTGDFLGNKVVFDEIKNDFADPYLNGQNHYAFFAKEAPKVNADIVGAHDLEIRTSMMRAINDYIEGKKTKDEAIQSWKDEVKTNYPDIIIE